MKNKIKIAREIINRISETNLKNEENALLLSLKEITDKAELTYNDVIIKRIKTKSAFQSMKEIENKLDELLKNAQNIQKNQNELFIHNTD